MLSVQLTTNIFVLGFDVSVYDFYFIISLLFTTNIKFIHTSTNIIQALCIGVKEYLTLGNIEHFPLFKQTELNCIIIALYTTFELEGNETEDYL